MRIFGKRATGRIEEEKTVKLKMGGYEVGIYGRGDGPAELATLDVIFESELKQDSKLERCGRNIFRLKEPEGTFSQQVLELVEVFSHEMLLFPVEFTDAFTRTVINNQTSVELYNEHWKSRPIGPFAGFNVMFEGAAEPLNVLLEIPGIFEIWDTHFTFSRARWSNAIEKKSRMIPVDEDYAEAVLNKKAEEIYAQMERTVNSDKVSCCKSGIIPAGIGLGEAAAGKFEVTAPIPGRQIIRWIIQAALDCGVRIAETALAEWDLKLPERPVN